MLRVNTPRPSVRVESIGPPAPPMVTRCSTTQARASGVPSGPPCTTRPETTTRCARRSPPAPPTRQARVSALRSELAEVFRIEVLEVRLELVGVERFGAGLAARLDPDREHTLPFLLLKDHHRGVGGAIEPEMRDSHLDHVGRQVPISQEAR